jgi:hypothetical protein
MLIVGTRMALGAGLALLVGDRLSPEARKGAGWALTAMGVLTTLPLLVSVLGKAPLDPLLARRA